MRDDGDLYLQDDDEMASAWQHGIANDNKVILSWSH
jgi:hypothetical protein